MALHFRRLQGGFDSAHAGESAFWKVVFPNPDDPPSAFSQDSIHLPVPELIRSQLPFPEWTIVDRHVGVLRTGIRANAKRRGSFSRLSISPSI